MTNGELLSKIIRKELLSETCYATDSFFGIYSSNTKALFYELVAKSLDFHFSIENGINAYALYVQKTPVICISTGLLEGLYDYIYRLCENPAFFPYVASPHRSDSYTKERQSPYIDKGQIIFSTSLFHNPERMGFANMLANLAMWFTIMHEMGHHIEGHIDYLIDNEALSFLCMTEKVQNTAITSKSVERQCIEMYADIFAARILAPYILSEEREGDMFTGYADNPEDRLFFLITAITILFSYLDAVFTFDKFDQLHKQYYLPTAFRNTLFLSTIFDSLIKFKYNLSINHYHELIQHMRMGVIVSLQDTYGNSKTNFFKMLSQNEYILKHYSFILEHSKVLHESLMKYSLIDLNKVLPPDQILPGYIS